MACPGPDPPHPALTHPPPPAQLAMAGTLIYQMGAPGGQPWSAANAIAGARNMNPMTLVFLLNMLSGLF